MQWEGEGLACSILTCRDGFNAFLFVMSAELRAMIQEMIEASGYSTASSEGDEETPMASSVSLDAPRWPTPSPNDVLFRGSISRHFCGEGRSDSPFGELSQCHSTHCNPQSQNISM